MLTIKEDKEEEKEADEPEEDRSSRYNDNKMADE